MTQVVILCGGKGTRLYPLTKDKPKSLIEVCGKPFIYYQLEMLANQDIGDIVLCTGLFSEQIEDYIGTLDLKNEFKIPIKITIVIDYNQIGTLNALITAYSLLKNRFFVMYGDSYLTDPRLKYITELYESRTNDAALMTLIKNPNTEIHTSFIKVGNTDYMDYGFIGLTKNMFDEHFIGNRDFKDIINDDAWKFIMTDHPFYEIGSHEGLAEFTKYIEQTRPQQPKVSDYFTECKNTLNNLDNNTIEKIIKCIRENKEYYRGQLRLFILGVGGSAANASHAVNDFRKLCNIEAYSPSDNVSELTARTNDNGWESSYVDWLKVSNLNYKDILLIMSVGGGDKERNISVNLINAVDYANEKGARVFGILGRDGGYIKDNSTCSVVIKTNDFTTPITEAFQGIIWHYIVTQLQENKTTW